MCTSQLQGLCLSRLCPSRRGLNLSPPAAVTWDSRPCQLGPLGDPGSITPCTPCWTSEGPLCHFAQPAFCTQRLCVARDGLLCWGIPYPGQAKQWARPFDSQALLPYWAGTGVQAPCPHLPWLSLCLRDSVPPTGAQAGPAEDRLVPCGMFLQRQAEGEWPSPAQERSSGDRWQPHLNRDTQDLGQ